MFETDALRGALPLFVPTVLLFVGVAYAADNGDDGRYDVIDEITVHADRVANTEPAGTYSTVVTALRFDPLTEIQSRGLPEGQADITVRGGLFENTGFKLGAVTIMDPQTGHYFAELPIDPAGLGRPEINKGVDNAITGFNSSVATVDYALRRLEPGGQALLGAGNDDLNFQSLRLAAGTGTPSGAEIVAGISAAMSEGDGSVPNGDHDFERFNLHVQRSDYSGDKGAQSDFIVAYQDKFYGWPGAYTGFPNLAETDHTRTTLVFGNHRQDIERGWFEVGAYYRHLENDYDFDRTTQESGVPGAFEHETQVVGLGAQGSYRAGGVDWRYGAQFTADELVRSTDLTEADFDKRRYLTASLVPSFERELNGGGLLTWRAGATFDSTNEDGSTVLPLVGVSLTNTTGQASTILSLDYAKTSQVPGYTVLKSRPTGLFGGNPDLGRERASQATLSLSRATHDWQATVAAFYRRDDNLVDWTFLSGAPFARQANAVDIDVVGFETLVTAQWQALEVAAGYTWLDKDADYGSALVDASYYALNFARHRLTLALRYRLGEQFELRLDNEYRAQEDNPLRTSDDDAYLGAVALAWRPRAASGFAAALTVDNLADSDFEPFPGTPAVGRQVSLSASYRW